MLWKIEVSIKEIKDDLQTTIQGQTNSTILWFPQIQLLNKTFFSKISRFPDILLFKIK